MRSTVLIIVLTLSLALAFFSGCAEAPQQEIEAANAALEAAKAVEADSYVADEFNAVQDSLTAVLADIEAENSKMALLRDYGSAKEKLMALTEKANQARDNAVTRKEEVRQEVEQSHAAATAALQETKALLAKAPKGKEGRAALDAMQSELSAVETWLNEASGLITKGDYLAAQDKVNTSMEKIQSINEELKSAMAKKGR